LITTEAIITDSASDDAAGGAGAPMGGGMGGMGGMPGMM